MPPDAHIPLKCPVCGARFRGSVTCTRCGTDLRLLMRLAAKAWSARQQSAAALRDGNLEAALRLSAAAERLQRTSSGIG
jgi:hypothetical protein